MNKNVSKDRTLSTLRRIKLFPSLDFANIWKLGNFKRHKTILLDLLRLQPLKCYRNNFLRRKVEISNFLLKHFFYSVKIADFKSTICETLRKLTFSDMYFNLTKNKKEQSAPSYYVCSKYLVLETYFAP